MPTTTAPIMFAVTEDKDSSELGGASAAVYNAIADASGAMRHRPAISTWNTFAVASTPSGSPVIGMTVFKGNLVYVTADRKIHTLTASGAAEELTNSLPAFAYTRLDGSGRPVMVPGHALLAIAGGGAIQKWDGSGLTARLTNTGAGGAPPSAGSICAIARRLVAQVDDESGEMWWSGPLDAWEDWDMSSTGGADFTQVAAKPDPLVAVREAAGEVFAWGKETLQVYAPSAVAADPNDPTNLIDFMPARSRAVGTLSPHSIIAVDDMFAFLDNKRRFVLSDGREMSVISKPIGGMLLGLSKVSDCWGFRMRFGRFDALVWFFPTANVGLIWDAQGNRWSEWREGDDGTGPLSITSAFDWAEQGVFLVGLSNGSIAQLDPDANVDIGGPILVDMRSGFSDRGTMMPKACNGVTFTFRRTWADLPPPLTWPTGGLTRSGRVRIYYRDYEGAWKLAKDTRLSADKRPVISIRSLGVYQTRQWRVVYGGEDELQLVSAQEEVEILEAA